MADAEIVYYNELRSKLIAPFDVKKELSDHMSYYVQGYKHMPMYKAGRWDGKIRLFDMRSGLFLKNHLVDVVEFLKEEGLTWSFRDAKMFLPKVKIDADDFLSRVSEFANLEPTDFQERIIKKALAQNQGLILSPTSSGKSFLQFLITRAIMEACPSEKILITTQSLMLVEQLLADFKDYSDGLGWNADDFVQLVGGKRDLKITKQIVIGTWQTCHKQSPEWLQQFDHYICDEAHQADGKSIKTLIDGMQHAKVRLGLTGTLDGSKMHELEMRGLFGPIIKEVTTRELMDRGFVADLEIECLSIKYPQAECKIVRDLKTYQKEVDFVIGNKQRNRLILEKALEFDGNTLILFNYNKKHGRLLQEMLEPLADKSGKQVYYITGEVDNDERMLQKNNMEKHNNVILLASYGTLSTGVSIKNIEQVIFAHPFKARIRNLQSIGRGLRMRDGKTKVKLVDICDDLRVSGKGGKITKLNHLYRHFVNRLDIYESEEFDYTIKNINFEGSLL